MLLYGLVIAVHVLVCIVLILVILLQAGRGGGLSEVFSGGASQTLFGTKANVFLTKATTACAVIFLVTCLLLGIMTSRRGKSLVQIKGWTPEQAQGIPVSQPLEQEKEKAVLDEAKTRLPKAEPEAPESQ